MLILSMKMFFTDDNFENTMATHDNDVVSIDSETVSRYETGNAEALPENIVSHTEDTKEVPQHTWVNGAENDNTIIKGTIMKGMVSVYKPQSEKTFCIDYIFISTGTISAFCNFNVP